MSSNEYTGNTIENVKGQRRGTLRNKAMNFRLKKSPVFIFDVIEMTERPFARFMAWIQTDCSQCEMIHKPFIFCNIKGFKQLGLINIYLAMCVLNSFHSCFR